MEDFDRLKRLFQLALSGGRFGERSFLHFAAADAGRADPNPLAGAVYQGMYALQIQIPAAFSYVVGVADPITELRPTATDFTNFCHKTHLCPVLLSV